MTYKKSKTGMYEVELARSHEVGGFLYKPGAAKTVVNEEILGELIAADVVTSVSPA